jgi:hypothetical protein
MDSMTDLFVEFLIEKGNLIQELEKGYGFTFEEACKLIDGED